MSAVPVERLEFLANGTPEADDSGLQDEADQSRVSLRDLTETSGVQQTPHNILQYYRYFGSTAIAPGYKKISLKIANEDFDHNRSSDKFHKILQDAARSVIDPRTSLPRSELLPPILDAFFEYYGSNFCFLNRAQLQTLIRENDISVFLLCSIAALSSRFCSPDIFLPYLSYRTDGAKNSCWQQSLPFLSHAKSLLMPLLSVPSCDLVAGLLFLALAEFGDNNEAGKMVSRTIR